MLLVGPRNAPRCSMFVLLGHLLYTLVSSGYLADDEPPQEFTSKCYCPNVEKPSLAATCDNNSPFMVFLEALVMTQCSMRDPMLCYAPDLMTDSVDFIVIGAGSAGAVVTSRLSEITNWKVTLLEAGGAAPTGTQIPAMYFNYQKSSIDWNYPIEKQANSCLSSPGGFCTYPRGKVMGGTSVLHGNMYMRGNKEDYEAFAKHHGLKNWDWEGVLPYFKKSEDNLDFDTIKEFAGSEKYHSKGGYLTVSRYPEYPETVDYFMKAAKELGYKVMGNPNGESQMGFTVAQMTVNNGERMTSAKAFLYRPEVLRRKNLNIITHSQVLRILFDKNNRAIGVTYMRNGITKTLLAKKEVILCAGAIASPQLLLLSGVGPRNHLMSKGIPVVADLPGVGQHLHNHVSVSIPLLFKKIRSYNRLNVSTLANYVLRRKGALTSTAMSQVTGFIRLDETNKNPDLPDIQFFFEGLNANCSSTGFNIPKSNRQRMIKIIPTLLRPKSRGFIELASSSSTAYPRIVSNYFKESYDLELLLKSVKFVKQLVNTEAMKEVGVEIFYDHLNGLAQPCKALQQDSDDYWRCIIRHLTNPENHQMATCKMGPENDPMSVLNDKLQVKKVHNLRVIDASAIPAVVSGNINAPVIMTGEKGADIIKEHWLGSKHH